MNKYMILMLICTMFSAVSQILLKQRRQRGACICTSRVSELARDCGVSDFWQCTSFKYVCLHTGRFEIRSGVGYLYVRLCPAAFLWRFERKGIKRKADWESDYYPGGTGVYIAVKRSDDGKKAISAKQSLSFEIGGLRTTNERSFDYE